MAQSFKSSLFLALILCYCAINIDGAPGVYEGPPTLLDGYMDGAQYFIDSFTKPPERLFLSGTWLNISRTIYGLNKTAHRW